MYELISATHAGRSQERGVAVEAHTANGLASNHKGIKLFIIGCSDNAVVEYSQNSAPDPCTPYASLFHSHFTTTSSAFLFSIHFH